jgi:hypothetical protein
MSAAERYFTPGPAPKRLDQLSRQQLTARIQTLRQVLDLLWGQSDLDGGFPYRTIGRAKIELIELETDLREIDRTAEPPMPVDVALAVVIQQGA